jgi:hypothetical protein
LRGSKGEDEAEDELVVADLTCLIDVKGTKSASMITARG